MRDIKTLLLGLLSFGLVGTWVYHLYDKTQYSNQRKEIFVKDSAAVAEAIRDSLHKIYSTTINELDTRLDSTKTNVDSLKGQLDHNLGEIYRLKNEIGTILKNRGATRADLESARGKIDELKLHVEDLRTQNTSMEEEKKRLNAILDQLSTDMKGLEQNVKRLGDENRSLTEKINIASVFVASEMKLIAVAEKNGKEQETNLSKKANKFVISFTVQNNIGEYNSAEVYVVITKPDGSVMQNSIWDAGSFETRNEGTRNYTIKMHFEYNKGEPKKLLFTLTPDDYQKGNYTMQLYHNGTQIGKTIKSLI